MKSKLAKLEQIIENQQPQEVHIDIVEPILNKINQTNNLPASLLINFTIAMTVPIQRDQQILNKYKSELVDNLFQFSKYNNPLFLQYYGFQINDPSFKIKENDQQNQIKKEESKQKKQENTIKQLQINIQSNLNGQKQPQQSKIHKKESQNHKSIKNLKEIKKEQIVKSSDSQFVVNLLAEPRVHKFQISEFRVDIKSKQQFAHRLHICFQLIEAVHTLHQLQQSFFPNNIEQCLFIKQNKVKVATHMFSLWNSHSEDNLKTIKAKQMTKIKKDALVNRSLKYVSPQFLFQVITLKDVRHNDIWKVGLLILGILSGQDFKDQINALQNITAAKIKQHKTVQLTQAKLSKLKKYIKNNQIQIIVNTLNILPEKRTPLKTILTLFSQLQVQLNQNFNQKIIQLAKKNFLQQDSKKSKFLIQIKTTEELFTVQLRKKIMDYLKVHQNRIVKDYKLFYRASHSKFSVRLFYQTVFERRNLLIVLLDKKQNKKVIVFCQEGFDQRKCNGVFGGYIKDSKKLSFIYSPLQNQFCKLRNPDRAMAVSYVQGPIIGDGDIIFSQGGINCSCRFPVSYEPGKLKKLLAERFELLQYDIYQVTFAAATKQT